VNLFGAATAPLVARMVAAKARAIPYEYVACMIASLQYRY
jgi:hypothetical protein